MMMRPARLLVRVGVFCVDMRIDICPALWLFLFFDRNKTLSMFQGFLGVVFNGNQKQRRNRPR